MFAVTVKAHYVAIQRINDRLLSAFIVVGAGAILEMILSVAGGRMGGLLGFAQGWVIAVYLEALVVIPVLLRAADIGWLRVRRYGGVSR